MLIGRIFAQIAALCLALLMCTGCGAKKEAPALNSSAEPAAAAASIEEEAAAEETESAEEAAAPTEQKGGAAFWKTRISERCGKKRCACR